jgi:hypothetical protein
MAGYRGAREMKKERFLDILGDRSDPFPVDFSSMHHTSKSDKRH